MAEIRRGGKIFRDAPGRKKAQGMRRRTQKGSTATARELIVDEMERRRITSGGRSGSSGQTVKAPGSSAKSIKTPNPRQIPPGLSEVQTKTRINQAKRRIAALRKRRGR